MKNKLVVGLKFFGLSAALTLLASGSNATAQKIVTVCPPGLQKSCDYTSILAAIIADTTPGGSTIRVQAGTYKESLRIEKGLTLEGDGPGKTILEGSINIFTGRAAILVTGFTVKGQGIQVVDSSAVALQNNEIIESGGDGLMIVNRSIVTVRGTTIKKSRGSGIAVVLDSTAIISASEVVSNSGDGISSITSKVILMDNVIAANRGCGIRADQGSQLFGGGNRGGGVLVPKDFATIQEAIDKWPIAGREPNSSGNICGSIPPEQIPPGLIPVDSIGAIVIEAGTYKEKLNITGKLVPIMLQGDEKGGTSLDGGSLGMVEGGIAIGGSASVTIKDLTICNFDGNGLYIWGAVQVTIQKSRICKNWRNGLDVGELAKVRILYNIISDNREYGIRVKNVDSVFECKGNTMNNNGKGDYDPSTPGLKQKCEE
jgi:hypothetical protein